MRPEIINLQDVLGDIIYRLDAASAAVADLAEMYPLPYAEDDHTAMAAMADRLEDSVFRFNVRFNVFTTNLARYGNHTKTDIRQN